MNTNETISRDAFGGIVIKSKVAKSTGRLGLEKNMFPGVEVGLAGWERAHSQGNITGHESQFGIRYAPAEVNQQYQRLGIERYIRDILSQIKPENELYLTTVTHSHSGTLRLKEIQYKLEIKENNQFIALFEASISVENKKENPRIIPTAKFRTPVSMWEKFFIPIQPKKR